MRGSLYLSPLQLLSQAHSSPDSHQAALLPGTLSRPEVAGSALYSRRPGVGPFLSRPAAFCCTWLEMCGCPPGQAQAVGMETIWREWKAKTLGLAPTWSFNLPPGYPPFQQHPSTTNHNHNSKTILWTVSTAEGGETKRAPAWGYHLVHNSTARRTARANLLAKTAFLKSTTEVPRRAGVCGPVTGTEVQGRSLATPPPGPGPCCGIDRSPPAEKVSGPQTAILAAKALFGMASLLQKVSGWANRTRGVLKTGR